MSQKLLEVIDPELVASGIAKDSHPLQAPLWVDGRNVVFRDGKVRKAPGRREIFQGGTFSVPTRSLKALLFDGVPTLFWSNSEMDDDVWVLVRFIPSEYAYPTAGFAYAFGTELPTNTIISLEAFGSWCLSNYGAVGDIGDVVNKVHINKTKPTTFGAQSANPASLFVPVANSPAARILLKAGVHMLAINTKAGNGYSGEVGPGFFSWSAEDDVEEWNQAEADFLPIRDLSSEILSAAPIGNAYAMYTENEMAVANYLGAPYYFGAEVKLRGIGASSQNSIVSRGRLNYGISKDGAWVTDGNSYEFIDPPYIRKWLRDNVIWDSPSAVPDIKRTVNGSLNEQQGFIEWSVPVFDACSFVASDVLTGVENEPRVRIRYDFNRKHWTFKTADLSSGLGSVADNSWCGALARGVLPYPVTAGVGNSIQYEEYGLDRAGSFTDGFGSVVNYTYPIHSWVQSKPFHCGNATLEKILDYVKVHMSELAGTAPKLYVGIQRDLNDAITWMDPQTLSDDGSPLFYKNATGFYISIKIDSHDVGSDWACSGFELWGVTNGAQV